MTTQKENRISGVRMSERKACVTRCSNGYWDTGDYFKRNTLFFEEESFLPSATKNKRVTRRQPRDSLAFTGFLD